VRGNFALGSDAGRVVMSAIVWPLLIYWLVLFVGCFAVVEMAQDQLYDQITPRAGLKVAGGSFLLAALLTVLRRAGFPTTFESMFTTNIAWTLLQGVAWFGVFTLIYRFHPWHAAGLGIVTMLLLSGLATMGVESLLAKPAATAAATRSFNATPPVRQSLTPGPAADPGKAAQKAQ
jgi:hypothetical protein